MFGFFTDIKQRVLSVEQKIEVIWQHLFALPVEVAPEVEAAPDKVVHDIEAAPVAVEHVTEEAVDAVEDKEASQADAGSGTQS